jgi:hypothetical protein
MNNAPNPQPDMTMMAQGNDANAVLARLAIAWDIDQVRHWMQDEQGRGTPAPLLTRALGNLMAGAAWGVAMNTSNPMDAGKDIRDAFEQAMANKASRLTQGAKPLIFRPTAAEIANEGAMKL